MREIEYRRQLESNKKWVYGFLVVDYENSVPLAKIYFRGGFGYVIPENEVKWAFGGLCLCNVLYSNGHYCNMNIKIIGNIHNDPELLEVSNE